MAIPENLVSLHLHEDVLRGQAIAWVKGNARLSLNVHVIERAMNLANVLRQHSTTDEDLKVIQLLGMRTFNAFGASLKLALSGYFQNGALIMRDTMETVFLIDLFQGDRSLIEKWRFADKQARIRQFGPVKVRMALDERDGFTSKKRAEIYEMYSELAGHPNMNSSLMMRPKKGGDVVIGPYMEDGTLKATLDEMGRLAVQVGEQLNLFFPTEWEEAQEPRLAFARAKWDWIAEFYPKLVGRSAT